MKATTTHNPNKTNHFLPESENRGGVPPLHPKEPTMPTAYCRHIRPSGRRCQMFALRNKSFCYHHESANAHLRTLHPPDDGTANLIHPMNLTADTFREPLVAQYYSHTRGPLDLRFPPLEDANSIQIALSMLITALGQNRIEARRATTMLYALQVASANARNLTHNESCVVTDTMFDDDGNLLSPDEDPEEIIESQLHLAERRQRAKDKEESDTYSDDDEEEGDDD